MTIVAGIAAIAASSLLLLAPAVVLAAAQGRRQADRTAAAELERRRAVEPPQAKVRFEFKGDKYVKAFDDIAKAMEAERRRRTLSGEEG